MAGNDSPLRKLGVYMGLVYTFPTALIVPALAGWWLDNKLGTKPWFIILGFLLGLGAGFTYLFKSLSMLGKGGKD
jgi:F0F1-type ATP synthase assembly protein I